MKTKCLILCLFLTACTKHPDAPVPVAVAPTPDKPTPPPTPPPASHCQGATVPISLPLQPIADAEVKAITIPDFYLDCGDTVRVYIGHGPPWSEIPGFDNSASYYDLAGNVVTVHNKTGQALLVDIEAILK